MTQRKRQTVDVNAIRKQAEERGRELGRQDLAIELMDMIAAPETPDRLRDLYYWLEGRASNDDNFEAVVSEGSNSVRRAMHVLRQITEEANRPAF